MERGRLIALEGLDGSGTTTQAARLEGALSARGHRVIVTHEPSDRVLGKSIRAALRGEIALGPEALALLFAADRMDHVTELLEPALAEGTTVICDRYLVSSWVYQSLACAPEWVRAINRFAPWPDLTLVLEVPAEAALQRVVARGHPLDLFETRAVQERVALAYRGVVEEDLVGVVAVDGTASIERVTEGLLAHCTAIGL